MNTKILEKKSIFILNTSVLLVLALILFKVITLNKEIVIEDKTPYTFSSHDKYSYIAKKDGIDKLELEDHLEDISRENAVQKFAEQYTLDTQFEDIIKQEYLDKIEEEVLNNLKAMQPVDDIESSKISQYGKYGNYIEYYCALFNFNHPDIIYAIILTESNENPNADNGYAGGLTQIEYTLEDSFAQFGRDFFGETWTLDDRFIPHKAIAFTTYRLRELYMHYDGDLDKVVQGYNFSHYSLDKLIDQFGDDWKAHRSEIVYYNGVYERTGSTSYGNPKYLEKVISKLT